jgi:hypothetical protein
MDMARMPLVDEFCVTERDRYEALKIIHELRKELSWRITKEKQREP